MTRTNSSTTRKSRGTRAAAVTALAVALLAGTASSTAGLLLAASPAQGSVQDSAQGSGPDGNGWGG